MLFLSRVAFTTCFFNRELLVPSEALPFLENLVADMPLITPIVNNATKVLLCTKIIAAPVSGVAPTSSATLSEWWHSSVFVTTWPPLMPTDNLNAPDLTTIYTPDPSCVDRWMLRPVRCDAAGSTQYQVFSVDPSKSIVSDASYKACQKYGAATYSPGVCPSGHTIAEVTAYHANASTGTQTFWQASCCRR